MWVLRTELGSCKSKNLRSLSPSFSRVCFKKNIKPNVCISIWLFLIFQVYTQTQFHYYNVNNLTILSMYDHISSKTIAVVI